VNWKTFQVSHPHPLESEEDESGEFEEAKDKKSNKERSRWARVRKKKYIEELEDWVRELEKENLDLKESNHDLTEKISFLAAGGQADKIDKY